MVEQLGRLATTVWLAPSEVRLLKIAVNVAELFAVVVKVRLCPPVLTVNKPAVGLVRVTTDVAE